MRIISFIFFLLFVSIVMHGKTKHSFKINNHNTISKDELRDLKHIKIFCGNSKNEGFVINKKQKSKSRAIISPTIPGISLNQIHVYPDFPISLFETRYTSFLYCVERKRGPPIK